MTAPVARFSRRIPFVEVKIIMRDVRAVEIERVRRMPIIMTADT